MKTLIVDDEKPARDRLRMMLGKEPDIEIVGEATNGNDAIAATGELRPDLLFLDVQMPGRTGIEVLRALSPEAVPITVFTTAYDTYAVDAFSVRALDYLLKPFTPDRLHEAIERAREVLRQRDPAGGDPRIADLLKSFPPRGGLERILVKLNERYVVVRTEEIEWVEAAANYVVLHTRAGNHVLRKALSTLETELSNQQFFRVSRSAIVNLAFVSEIQFVSSGEHVVVLRTGARVSLTRSLRELQERLQATR